MLASYVLVGTHNQENKLPHRSWSWKYWDMLTLAVCLWFTCLPVFTSISKFLVQPRLLAKSSEPPSAPRPPQLVTCVRRTIHLHECFKCGTCANVSKSRRCSNLYTADFTDIIKRVQSLGPMDTNISSAVAVAISNLGRTDLMVCEGQVRRPARLDKLSQIIMHIERD